ncbi:rCG41176 [Rattus norvegicus]|nr:rCG41176 [Rattus norvegicus]
MFVLGSIEIGVGIGLISITNDVTLHMLVLLTLLGTVPQGSQPI